MFQLRRLRGIHSKLIYTHISASGRRAVGSPLPFAQLLSCRSQLLRHSKFTTSAQVRADEAAQDDARTPEEIERVVREAAERWKDTLPKDYLNAEEMVVYERLFGPPLRETEPEDVGIPTHADMEDPMSPPDNSPALLRSGEDGILEQVMYEIPGDQAQADQAAAPTESEAVQVVETANTYVDAVSRNPREHAALLKLSQDFEAAQKAQRESEQRTQDGEAEVEETAAEWPAEEDWNPESPAKSTGKRARFHPFTLAGHYYDSPVQKLLPKETFVEPIRQLLTRSSPTHVAKAAQESFGGPGLPNSPATPKGLRNGNMVGVGLHPGSRRMTAIQADAFVATYLPPMYASILSILGEVRKRLGSQWLQSPLKTGHGLSILDVGGGGAGLVAWDEVLRAEWEVLKDDQKVDGEHPPLWKKTTVVGSDQLRDRIKYILDDTTFLPRLPDYEHSGKTHGENIDAGDKAQPRKQYDVVIASHLFLQEPAGHRRQAILNSVWNTLSKDGGVLIVIEKAHPRGFEAVAHVRDTLLKQFLLPESGEPRVEDEKFNPAFQHELEPGHVIAPCTNQGTCPMYTEPGENHGRKDMCHFRQRFVRPMFHMSVLGDKRSEGDVQFSYVAIRRGVPRSSALGGEEATQQAFDGYAGSLEAPDMQSLPRLILPPLKRTRHVTMDVCTAKGTMERWTVPKSYGAQAYHDARKSQWGDLWALGAKTRTDRKIRLGRSLGKVGEREKRGKKPHKVTVTMEGGRIRTKEKNASASESRRRPANADEDDEFDDEDDEDDLFEEEDEDEEGKKSRKRKGRRR